MRRVSLALVLVAAAIAVAAGIRPARHHPLQSVPHQHRHAAAAARPRPRKTILVERRLRALSAPLQDPAVAHIGVHALLLGTVLTLPIEDGLVRGVPGDDQNRLALLRVLPFAEGAAFASIFLLLRTYGVNHDPQAFAYGCSVSHPLTFFGLVTQYLYTLQYTRLVTSIASSLTQVLGS